jgi:predicted RNase H-like nuclease (RuvC/YqgF family)
MSACETTVTKVASSGGGKMERQLGKLESDVEHIKTDIAGLKSDSREFRSEVRSDMGKLRDLHERDFRILFGAIIVVAIGIASIMAKAFGWLK